MKRRPDIDGLRAVAVAAVVLYHTGLLHVSGGFVGVDVFFVISGYLITGLVMEDIRNDRFSIGYFYERRVRRILPALFVVLLASSIAAWFLFLPHAAKDYGLSLIATVSFWSNQLFRSQTGYFQTRAETKPLLHTWSLAVEEQFYVFYPVFLFLIGRYFRKRYAIAIGCVLLASLSLSVWRIETNPNAMFYLAPARAWELMIGGLLATGVIPELRHKAAAHALGLLGLGLIGYSAFAFSAATLFPGANALFPCIGAALAIYSGGGAARPLTARALSARPVVFLGLISYSLYLWHWVILVFTKYYLVRSLTRTEAAAVITASLLAATLSWRFIENPFRGRDAIGTRSAIFFLAAVMTVFFAAGGGLAYFSGGFPGRFSAAIRTMDAGVDDVWSRRIACENQICHVGAPADEESFILWGDSHALALAPMVEQEARANGRSGAVASDNGCAPLLHLKYYPPRFGDCSGFGDAVLDYIAAHHIKRVFLHARWALYAEPGAGALLTPSMRPEKNLGVFEELLRSTLGELRRRNLSVVIIASVPETDVDVPTALARHALSGLPKDVSPRFADFMQRQGRTFETLRRVAEEYNVRIVYPDQTLCNPSACMAVKDGWPLYSDENHLSTHGAILLGPMFTGLLKESGSQAAD